MSRRTQTFRVEREDWVRLRPGVFCRREAWDRSDDRARHLLTCRAIQRTRLDNVVSHLSAAAAWGWPLPLDGAGRPWFTVDSHWADAASDPSASRVPARRLKHLRSEAADLPPEDVAQLPSGLLVTSHVRTLADCLRHLAHVDSVAIADVAGQVVSRASVEAVLARQGSWPYAENAQAALKLVDPRRESWLESAAAVGFARDLLPMPEAQARVLDTKGRVVARPDYWWREAGILCEIDGWSKYRSAGLTSVEDAERALRAEKEREDRLRELGHVMFRAATSDVFVPGLLGERWWGARETSDPGRIRGRVIPMPWPSGWPSPIR